jgi:hypothetical protein
MNNKKDFLEPVNQDYLGIPIREERPIIDQILKQEIYNQETVEDPNGTYRQIEAIVVEPSTALTTGDNKVTVTVPFDGELVATHAFVSTVSSSGVVEVSLQNKNNQEIIVGWIKIPANYNGSESSTTTPLIDPRYSSFKRYDQIKINIDSIGTGSKGLVVQLYFIVNKFYIE